MTEEKRRPIRILVVEDNDISRNLALYLIEKLGYEADAVENGREAIQLLAAKTYDIVLMDIQMPVMGGLEAIDIIRDPNSEVLDHQVPVIALTADLLDEDRNRCLERGMDAYMAKPLSPKEFFMTLERFVRQALEDQ